MGSWRDAILWFFAGAEASVQTAGALRRRVLLCNSDIKACDGFMDGARIAFDEHFDEQQNRGEPDCEPRGACGG